MDCITVLRNSWLNKDAAPGRLDKVLPSDSFETEGVDTGRFFLVSQNLSGPICN